MIFKFLDPLYFFLALFLGIFIVYISSPIPDVIIKYPTSDNAGKITYKDEHDVCYRYIANEVECPTDKTLIKSMDTPATVAVAVSDSSNRGILYNLVDRFSAH
jgi:hypothetical protein